MTAQARATAWGIETLWGLLTDELRNQLTVGGCPTSAYQRAIATSWQTREQRGAGLPMRLALEAVPDGVALRCLDTGTLTPLARTDFWLAFNWRGTFARLPMRLPADGSAPDAWGQLPREARERLEFDGFDAQAVNTATLERAREAIAWEAGGKVPLVELPMATKRAPRGCVKPQQQTEREASE